MPLILFSPALTKAEALPELLLSWKANSYIPPSYALKSLNVLGSNVTVSALLSENGSVLNSNNANFMWFVNNELFRQGLGLSSFSFKTLTKKDHTVSVKVIINGREISSAIEIKTAEPELSIISNGNPDNLKNGEKITLKAIPYFFTSKQFSDLDFSWNIDGTNFQTQNDNELNFDTQRLGYTGLKKISIEARATNKSTLFETAKKLIWINLSN